MKVKVSEATGPVLDYMVAKCLAALDKDPLNQDYWKAVFSMWEDYRGATRYSINWSQGGPIIEREKIDTCWIDDVWRGQITQVVGELSPQEYCTIMYATTPLIAACRCFVASRLGDEVEIPEELK